MSMHENAQVFLDNAQEGRGGERGKETFL